MGVVTKVLVSSTAFVGAIGAVAKLTESKRNAKASWTTNYTPDVKWDDNWDKRDPKSLVKPLKKTETDAISENKYNEAIQNHTVTASRHIFLIRHGQYVLDGATDNDRYLTELGREQAKLTGLRLKELGLHYDKIIVSTMTRAAESAQILSGCFPDVPLEACEMLREGAPIPPEPPVGHWRPEASQFFEDGARIEAAFRKYIHRANPSQKKDSHEIIMCHANVIRYFVCRALQFTPEAWLRFSLHHCSITWLIIRPSGRVILKGLGDSGHFPKNKMTVS